ncbi:hypothetical protein SLEP1_g1859 [Rubroshorea leprosula]|uniref:TF-B3 domain-containing protein n=1 Tax=Rubroshorea leprosula TaxID=152421 RepID=A0AAV5HPA9_9ROSI|nr:hypothetical protein SLEP1_g1859 [Rubroshorea leprosula]
METGTRFTPSKPHFFQPLLPNLQFQSELSIPVSFFERYLKGSKCERAVLRSFGGRTWPVKMKGRKFKDGWENFVQDHDLKVWDFVVFKHEGDMVFDVMVLDTSTESQREYPHFETKIKGEEENVKDICKPSASQKSGNPYFFATPSALDWKEYRLRVPRSFALSNGLSDGVREIKLVDEQKRSWTAKLIPKKGSNGIVRIGHDWRGLCIANAIMAGDSVKVELVEKEEKPVFKVYRLNPRD